MQRSAAGITFSPKSVYRDDIYKLRTEYYIYDRFNYFGHVFNSCRMNNKVILFTTPWVDEKFYSYLVFSSKSKFLIPYDILGSKLNIHELKQYKL